MFPLARQITYSKKPFVLAVPTMKWTFGRNKVGSRARIAEDDECVRRGSAQRAHECRLVEGASARPPHPGRPLARLRRAQRARRSGKDPESSAGALAKLTDVWLLDTTYGKRNRRSTAASGSIWATAHAKAPSFIKLRVLYRKASDTSDVAECIRDEAAKAALPNVVGQAPRRTAACRVKRCQRCSRQACRQSNPRAEREVFEATRKPCTSKRHEDSRSDGRRRRSRPDDPRWRTAADRESHGLGQSPPAQVTDGEFGKALASIDVPAVVTKLLRLSKTFMDMARDARQAIRVPLASDGEPAPSPRHVG